MAFRRRFSNFRPRSSGQRTSRQVPRWTAQTTDMTLTAAAPALVATLYSPGTTIGVGTYEEESLVVRIVGRLSARTLAATAAPGPIGIGLLKSVSGIGVTVGGLNDPFVATELATRDWMGVYNTECPPNSGANGWMFQKELDIRVKRRLKASENIMMVGINGLGVDSVVITIDVRILIVIRL